jgi:hypothetical protein
MLTPELQKIKEEYEDIMLEISIRSEHTARLIKGEDSTSNRIIDYETIAMYFRKVAELMIFANLVGHEKEYTALYTKINEEWNLGKIINNIKKINPYFYPYAWKETLDANGQLIGARDLSEGDWMTEDELKVMYGKCSDLIHARNPFKGALDYAPYLTLFDEWQTKINNLLNFHGVALPDKKHVIACRMNSSDTQVPDAAIFEMEAANGRMKLLG